MTASESSPRTVTIDAHRHRRIVRDLVVPLALNRPAAWWAGATVVVLFLVGLARDHPLAALLVALVVLSLQLLVWWVRIERSTRNGLAAGQTVGVAWAGDGELVVTDATGEYRLPRGSVILVRRWGSTVSVYGRSISFVLPGELLTDQDINALEGHAAPPASHGLTPQPLPLALVVTPEVRAHLVSDATRAVTRTADFLFPAVVALAFTGLALASRWPGVIGLAVFCWLLWIPTLVRFVRWRTRYANLYPVGRTLRAEVTPDHLSLETRHGTVALAWHNFDGVTATDHNVVLRHRRSRFGSYTVTLLPLAMLGPDDLHLMRRSLD